MKVDLTELRKGLAETRRYLLSHHEKSEWYRCYAVDVFGGRTRVCARCSGVYPGIVSGLLTISVAHTEFPYFYLVVLLPLPALADWALTSFTERRGYNVVRTATGALLGYGYGLGIGLLFVEFRLRILAVGAAYALLAGILIILERRTMADM